MGLAFVYHASSLSVFKYLIPLFLYLIPYVFQGGINFRFSLKDGAIGVMVSAIVLLPLSFFFLQTGKPFVLLPVSAVLFQLVGVSLPEEAYFRGFLQHRLGHTMKGAVGVSVLFALTHLPRLIFYGDPYSLLTFFPSIVMGFLYYRTSNILPSTIFHLLSNIVFLGFCDIL